MYAYMFVCSYVRMHACMYVRMCMYMYVSQHSYAGGQGIGLLIQRLWVRFPVVATLVLLVLP